MEIQVTRGIHILSPTRSTRKQSDDYPPVLFRIYTVCGPVQSEQRAGSDCWTAPGRRMSEKLTFTASFENPVWKMSGLTWHWRQQECKTIKLRNASRFCGNTSATCQGATCSCLWLSNKANRRSDMKRTGKRYHEKDVDFSSILVFYFNLLSMLWRNK
jgi:hypothetical protein